MTDDRLRKNIIRVLIVFSLSFLLLVGYLSYFEVQDGERMVVNQYNMRNKDKENEVLRGSMLDREMNVIVDSQRLDDNTQKRIYKEGYEMAYAPVVGYTGKHGKSGLEQQYNGELLNASLLNPFKFIRDVVTRADRKGNSLVLTIDSSLQKAAYDALKGFKGAVVAMDPKTGEILCMVSRPVFNPETIDKDWESIVDEHEEGYLINRAIAPGLYPPGSIFKVLVASEAIENIPGIESKTYVCDGSLEFGSTYSLNDFDNERHGNIKLYDALVHSCNVTFGQVGMDVGAEALKRGAGDFYFDKTIPIDLPGAAKSKFPDMNDSQKASIAQSAIGQYEVTVTPLQMLLVASAIANDGVIMKPHIVRSVADSYGVNLKVTDPEILARPIKKDTAQKVREMMVDVVRKGTGKRAAVEGIVVAGKTGTAETGGGRDPHSWFIAFAPAGDAKIVLAVIVEEGGTGGGKAAAITGKLIKEYLKK